VSNVDAAPASLPPIDAIAAALVRPPMTSLRCDATLCGSARPSSMRTLSFKSAS